MRSYFPRIIVLLVAGALGLAGCGEEQAAPTSPSPAYVEPIEGTNLKRVVLVPRAVERLDIRTVEVRPATPQEMAGVTPAGQVGRTAVPFDAVMYDKNGVPFTYTNPKDLEYVRQPITLDGIRNNLAVIAVGPPPGTRVVTVGASELYGVETGVGKVSK